VPFLRLLLEEQINIAEEYEVFNDVTKQQAGGTTHALEQRPLTLNSPSLPQPSPPVRQQLSTNT